MIEQQTVDSAVEFVRAIGQGSWRDIRWEHQDGGEFPLLAIPVPDMRAFCVHESQRLAILEGLGKMIPNSSKVRGPTWMVVFTHESKVVDSIYDDLD